MIIFTLLKKNGKQILVSKNINKPKCKKNWNKHKLNYKQLKNKIIHQLMNKSKIFKKRIIDYPKFSQCLIMEWKEVKKCKYLIKLRSKSWKNS